MADNVTYYHIFTAGTYPQPDFDNGCMKDVDINLDDLKKIARSYDVKFHEAPLWIGHPWGSGAPAYGWIDKLKVEDDKLLASFSHISPSAIKMIRDKEYKRVSVEFYNFGKGKERYLGAVGLTNMPLVKGLPELSFSGISLPEGFSIKPDCFTSVLPGDFLKLFSNQNLKPFNSINNMNDKISEFSKTLCTNLNIEITPEDTDESLCKKVTEKFTDVSMKLEEINTKNAEDIVKFAIEQKKILPHQKDVYISLAKSNFSATQNLLASMPVLPEFKNVDTPPDLSPGNANTTKGIPDDRTNWSYDDWQKKDPKGLASLKSNHPETFEKLMDAFYGA